MSFDSLETVLKRLISLHRNLLDLVREERLFLLSANISELKEITLSKELLLSEISKIEKTRILVVDELIEELKISHQESNPITLLQLSEHLNEAQSKTIRTLHTTLKLLIEQIRETGKQNMEFIQKSLGVFDEIKRDIDRLTSKHRGDLYGKTGSLQKSTGQNGKLFSRQG